MQICPFGNNSFVGQQIDVSDVWPKTCIRDPTFYITFYKNAEFIKSHRAFGTLWSVSNARQLFSLGTLGTCLRGQLPCASGGSLRGWQPPLPGFVGSARHRLHDLAQPIHDMNLLYGLTSVHDNWLVHHSFKVKSFIVQFLESIRAPTVALHT